VNKEVKEFCRRVERSGLIVERSGGGHFRITTQDGGTVGFIPFSPSTNRWRENTIAQLRRRGVELE
jgi:predicted RNA binding protein YcfA (HicA-like mRNA interferase family)